MNKQVRIVRIASLMVCALALRADISRAETMTAGAIQQRFDGQIKPLLKQYCGDCHFDGETKGDLDLEKFATLASVQSDRVTWQKVSDNLVTRVMPPPKRKTQPSEDERKLLQSWVRDALDYCDCSGPRDPGPATIRRLNRTEYNNTIRDLLGVADFNPAADFPADDTGYGFDNIADVLTMSPLLVEKYLAAAEQALDKVIVTDPPAPATVAKFGGSKMQGEGEGRPRTLASEGEAFRSVDFAAPGRYAIRVNASEDKAADAAAQMLLRVDGQDIHTFDVNAPRRAPRVFESTVSLTPGAHRIALAFINDYYDDSKPKEIRDRNLNIHDVEIVGPLDGPLPPPSDAQRRILFVSPGENGLSESQAAAKVLERFATRAYRRPASSDEVARLVQLFDVARADKESYEKSIKLALSGALVSPSFLYRIEADHGAPDSSGKPYFVGDYELATRLSYFLWSSMPDDALVDAAAKGKLRDPASLRAEVKRMLADPKADALVSNFVGQWLLMRNLASHSIDRDRIKGFSEELRSDMQHEVELFFANLIKEDRSVLELLDADYTFVNDRLARIYNIEGITGGEFRRVSLTGKPSRGGVLTMPGVLTVTAMPGRTSPVKRGKFVLEQLLGSAPPPQPANVPSLSERRADVAKGSVRQRFEIHRSDASCVACHSRMDPIGFAMENFDPIGRWRDTDNGFAVDATGVLPEGESFNGPAELRKMLVAKKDEFVRALTEKMLTYALGRGIELYDRCTVKDITAGVAKDGYKFSALINAIVESDTFQKRRAANAHADAPPK